MCLQILFWCKISKPFKLRTSLFAMFSLTAVKEFQQQQDPNTKRALESTLNIETGSIKIYSKLYCVLYFREVSCHVKSTV